MKSIWLFSLLIASLLLIFSCKTPKIEAPDQSKFSYPTPNLPVSGIAAPVAINLKELAQSVNLKFKGTLFQDLSFDDNGKDQLKLTVTKRSPFLISGNGNTLQIAAPLKFEGTYRIQQKVLGIDINREQPFAVNTTILLNSVPSVDANWNLNLKTKTQVRWEDLPVIEIGSFKLDFPAIFANAVKSQTDKISQYIDTEIPKMVNLRNEAQKNWEMFKSPIQLDQTTDSWLSIRPQQAYLSPIQVNDSLLKIQTGLSAIVQVVAGGKPSTDWKTTLPELKTGNPLKEEVNINLLIGLPFELVNAELKKFVGASGYQVKGEAYDISILEAIAFPLGDKLQIGLRIEGKVKKAGIGKNIKGIVYAEGKPVYNAQTQKIEIKGFDFDVKTRDILVKSASWLINSNSFKESVSKQLQFDIAPQLEEAKKTANKALNQSYGQNLDLTGNLERIEPGQVYLSASAIQVQVAAKGRIFLRLKNLIQP